MISLTSFGMILLTVTIDKPKALVLPDPAVIVASLEPALR